MISSERVNELFQFCLFKDGEDLTKQVIAEGITASKVFYLGRLEEVRSDVKAILLQLPNQFMKSGGGGWTVLNMCNDKEGNQWTGFHEEIEKLVQLGIGLKMVECQLPREFWSILPGGMPYYVVIDQ